jgi:hypothetical protein
MEILLLGVLLGFPVIALAGLAAYAYVDAPNYGMRPRKWAAISFFLPLFGFFAYLFEREERTPDPEREEMFVDGPFEIHESRADDAPFVSAEDGDDVRTDDGRDRNR